MDRIAQDELHRRMQSGGAALGKRIERAMGANWQDGASLLAALPWTHRRKVEAREEALAAVLHRRPRTEGRQTRGQTAPLSFGSVGPKAWSG
jgi:hypothetical protein